MHRRRLTARLVLPALLCGVLADAVHVAHAAGIADAPEPPTSPAPPALALSAGYAGVLRDPTGAVFGIEYRFRQSRRGLYTAALVGATSKSRYVNVSLGYTRRLWQGWYGTLSTGPGVYSHDAGGVDLGGPMEFFSRIEVAHALRSGTRLGVVFGHISNAHFAKLNPGNEVLSFTYTVRLGH